MNWLLRLSARLPLPVLHGLGIVLGWAVYWTSPHYRRRLKDNLRQSGLAPNEDAYHQLLRASVAEGGKGGIEVIVPWLRTEDTALSLVRDVRGWEQVEAALAQGKGVILITPHLGCFEMAGRFLASRISITFLYREPKQKWLGPIMSAGRGQGTAMLAPADLRGVRVLLRTLKHGGAVGILPDQTPGAGEGVWANFFGRPAYTMTLIGKLQQRTGAPIISIVAERLPRGAGYRVGFKRLPELLPADDASAARVLNQVMEDLIAASPTQYLWSYNRYKTPAGATPPPAGVTIGA